MHSQFGLRLLRAHELGEFTLRDEVRINVKTIDLEVNGKNQDGKGKTQQKKNCYRPYKEVLETMQQKLLKTEITKRKNLCRSAKSSVTVKRSMTESKLHKARPSPNVTAWTNNPPNQEQLETTLAIQPTQRKNRNIIDVNCSASGLDLLSTIKLRHSKQRTYSQIYRDKKAFAIMQYHS